MEIAVHPAGEAVEIRVSGRLDNTWSSFLAENLDHIVAGGARDLRIDLSEVNFLSSAGIGVLVQFYNQLRGIEGSFVVVRPSPRVSSVLKQVALESLLCGGSAPVPKPVTAVTRHLESATADYDIFELDPAARLRCHCYGDPGPVFSSAFDAQACRALPPCRFALGLGALGGDFEECRERFGELVAVAGATAYQPTERTAAADYLVCKDGALADVQVLYGLACEGDFRQLIRFEARRERGPLPIDELVRQCAANSATSTTGFVIIAEVAGIVGAALRRSPAGVEPVERFRYPQVGEWLSFSPERTLPRTVALITGVASSRPGKALLPFLRPLASTGLSAHLHAAVFSYRPMQRGLLPLEGAVTHLFDCQTLLAVLHLLDDPRPVMGAGQSEFDRGACWVGDVTELGAAA